MRACDAKGSDPAGATGGGGGIASTSVLPATVDGVAPPDDDDDDAADAEAVASVGTCGATELELGVEAVVFDVFAARPKQTIRNHILKHTLQYGPEDLIPRTHTT